MLDDYKEKQPIVYQMMKNAVINNKLSHAYLFDTKNCMFGEQMVLSFVKYLLCPSHKTNNLDCGQCTQCQKISDFNYIELKIIEPDGLWIKKEQMDELQEEFSKKSLEGLYKIYIIHQVERLNKAAANSLLKFLEEPEPGIIAILTTANIFQVLETIRSRCQILSLTKEKKEEIEKATITRAKIYIKNNIFDLEQEEEQEKYKNFIHNVIHFIEYIEKKGIDTLLYTNKLWHVNIKEKEEFLLAFDIMTFFYNDILNTKCERNLHIFFDEQELINELADKNDIEQISRKINVIMDLKKKIKINMNNNLLIDKLILELTRR